MIGSKIRQVEKDMTCQFRLRWSSAEPFRRGRQALRSKDQAVDDIGGLTSNVRLRIYDGGVCRRCSQHFRLRKQKSIHMPNE